MDDRLDLRRRLLDLAVSLAEEAGRVTLEHFGEALDPEIKSDGSPVTVADRDAEALLRERILAAHPTHGILGEEFGETNPDSPIRWILDPIDGTRSFVHGVPFYGVLVGIEIDGEPEVGVAHFPAMDETVAAARDLGCRWKRGNAEPVRDGRTSNAIRTTSEARVSEVSRLSDAVVLTTDEEATRSSPVADGWRDLSARASFSRTWGDCYGHCLVATGRAEVMLDPELNPWDAAPLLPIVTEAGGRFTDLSGAPTIHGGNGISTNGKLHDEILRILTGR